MTAQEFKNSILQMAIQGKLVKQDPNDEPASVLLDKIKEERDKLIKEKKIKKEKYSEIYKDPSDNHYYEKFEDGEINDMTEEIPFEIPDSWKWCRLKDICISVFSGKSPKYSKIKNNNLVLGQKNNQNYGIDLYGVKYCTDEFIRNYPKEMYLKKNDILLNTLGGGTVGRSGIFNLEDNKYITDGHLFVFRSIDENISNYILYYLKFNRDIIEKNADGSTNQIFLKLDNVKRYLLPLPPHNEISRIKNKINQLLPIINKYQEKSITLDNLNKSYKDELKKSILQYAIQGKLVNQNVLDEPSQKLIERILDEKRKLMKEKKIKKENLSIIYKDSSDNQFYEKFEDGTIKNVTDEIPFVIPENWCWIRLKNLFLINPKNKLDDNDFYSFVPMNLISDGYSNSCTYEIKKWNNIKKGFTHFKDGDIGFAKITPCFQNRKSLIFQNLKNGYGAGTTELIVLRTILSEMNNKYLLYILKSSYFIDNGVKTYSGTAGQQRINKEFVKNFLIPIPPIIEQKIITEKLDNIFNYLETAE